MAKVTLINGLESIPGTANLVSLQADTTGSVTLTGSDGISYPGLSLEGELLLAASAAPTDTANISKLYAKRTPTVELFALDDAGNEVQITNDGSLNSNTASGSFFTTKFRDKQEVFTWSIPAFTNSSFTTTLVPSPPESSWVFYLVRNDTQLVTNGTVINMVGDGLLTFNDSAGTVSERLASFGSNDTSLFPGDPSCYVDSLGRFVLTFDNSGGSIPILFSGVLTLAGPFVTPVSPV